MRKILITSIIILLILLSFAVFLRMRQGSETNGTPPIAGMYSSGNYNESITIDGRERTYLLHVPEEFDATKKYPLVLLFHGGGGAGENIMKKSSFDKKADEGDFIAAAPDGVEKTWNRGGHELKAEKLGIDDVKFTRELIASLKKRLPIDGRRIYATGFSNGAALSHLLACQMADTFAAIGPIGSSMLSEVVPGCAPVKPVPVVHIHGVDDANSPYNGGESGVVKGALLEGVPKTLEFWASKNGCDQEPTVEPLAAQVEDGTRVEKISYSNCREGGDILHYKVYGMGHAWPPALPDLPRVQGRTSNNLNATDVIWEFFKGHAKK